MEGPTPVSALIHAATMVTAGVYLVARAHPLFENAPNVQALVALLGLATLLMAGVVALVQTDIKRIIAYSTMSQIGYMFTAVGIGAYSAGMFHLLTHAFFKALLFLGAGVVIHALGGEQDVRRMGGLGSALPKTKWLMWIGTVALIGFWPLSKDGILASGLEKGGTTATIVWVGGLAGAFLTGVYATRLMRLTFYGERSQYAAEHLHTGHGEGPWVMMLPVTVLAIGTLLSGFLAIGFGVNRTFGDWLANAAPTIEPSTAKDILTTAIAWGLGAAGGLLAWRAYAQPGTLERLKRPFGRTPVIAEHKFYWDELYDTVAYIPAAAVAVGVYRFVERWVVWGTIDLVAFLVRMVARGTADAQTGVVRQYATVLVAGAAVLGVYFLSRATL
jgi:NADH-quinone oxidoreductase subunit L